VDAAIDGIMDYYPFGMLMPQRQYGSSWYRYGFNGKEMDNEVSGTGNIYDYGFRIYNPRLGRFLSVDPLTKSYPWYTPYQFAGNKPITYIDLDGLEEELPEVTKTTTYLTIQNSDNTVSLIERTIVTIKIPPKQDFTFEPGSDAKEITRTYEYETIIPDAKIDPQGNIVLMRKYNFEAYDIKFLNEQKQAIINDIQNIEEYFPKGTTVEVTGYTGSSWGYDPAPDSYSGKVRSNGASPYGGTFETPNKGAWQDLANARAEKVANMFKNIIATIKKNTDESLNKEKKVELKFSLPTNSTP
jgi:RHS repeat-associated protein